MRVCNNLSLDERSRERYPHHGPSSRPHNTKIQYFANLLGENFLAWRFQFQVIASYLRWSDNEAKQLVYAYMKGTALESVTDTEIRKSSDVNSKNCQKCSVFFPPKKPRKKSHKKEDKLQPDHIYHNAQNQRVGSSIARASQQSLPLVMMMPDSRPLSMIVTQYPFLFPAGS